MATTIKNELLAKTDRLLNFISGLELEDNIPFTEQEVREILNEEAVGSAKNYARAIAQFQAGNSTAVPPKSKRFVVYWGYPGAGKSFMAQKLIERFGRDEDCLPFNIIDKDQHRNLFPNLFEHLKGGHIDECEKFASVTIDYVRKILDLSLASGERSILSIGAMGAGSEFKDNANKAIAYGYKPCAVYMAVNPDIAYLSNVYRSTELYDQIIFQNKELYPRLVSNEYFSRVVKMLPEMIGRIDLFQQENSESVDLLVLNRSNELLYDSRKPHQLNVQQAIRREEKRRLSSLDLITINKQLTRIYNNLAYRSANKIYAPCKSEIEIVQKAVTNIATLIRQQPELKKTNYFMPYTGTDGR